LDDTVTPTPLARAVGLSFNDDFVILSIWFGAITAFAVLDSHERLRTPELAFCIGGLVLHGLHSLVEFGDGEYFTMPLLALSQLRFIEELLEVLTLSAYLATFLLLQRTIRKRAAYRAANPPGDHQLLNYEELEARVKGRQGSSDLDADAKVRVVTRD
jgi:hypothetical protein